MMNNSNAGFLVAESWGDEDDDEEYLSQLHVLVNEKGIHFAITEFHSGFNTALVSWATLLGKILKVGPQCLEPLEQLDNHRVIVVEFRDEDNIAVNLHVLVNGYGIRLGWTNLSKGDASPLISWQTIAQAVITADPHLFGPLENPHDGVLELEIWGFRLPEDLGFSADENIEPPNTEEFDDNLDRHYRNTGYLIAEYWDDEGLTQLHALVNSKGIHLAFTEVDGGLNSHLITWDIVMMAISRAERLETRGEYKGYSNGRAAMLTEDENGISSISVNADGIFTKHDREVSPLYPWKGLAQELFSVGYLCGRLDVVDSSLERLGFQLPKLTGPSGDSSVVPSSPESSGDSNDGDKNGCFSCDRFMPDEEPLLLIVRRDRRLSSSGNLELLSRLVPDTSLQICSNCADKACDEELTLWFDPMGVTALEMRALRWYVQKGWHRNVHWPIGGAPASLLDSNSEVASTPGVRELGPSADPSLAGTPTAGSSEDMRLGTEIPADLGPFFIPRYKPDKCGKCTKSLEQTQSHLHVEVGMSRILLGETYFAEPMNVANFCQDCWGLHEESIN